MGTIVGRCRERVGSVYEGWPLLGSLALFLVVRCCGRCRVRLLLSHLVILSIFFVSSVRHWRFSFLGSKTLYCLAIDGATRRGAMRFEALSVPIPLQQEYHGCIRSVLCVG